MASITLMNPEETPSPFQPTTTGAIRIYLAAKAPDFLAGMRDLLGQQPNLRIVGATDLLEVVPDGASRLEPDVLVLDICLGEGACLEALPDIQRRRPRMKILVVTDGGWQDQQIPSALAGAHGFVYRPFELVKAIHLVQEGKVFFDAPALAEALNPPAPTFSPDTQLTEDEVEFLEFVRDGLSNDEIATKLGTELKAIYQRRFRLKNKLALKSARELVRFAQAPADLRSLCRPSPYRRILVVDDEPMVLQSVRMILKSTGHTVETAADARQALEKIEKGKFDLVVSDLRLPGMQGDELAREIKARDPSQRVILLTGFPPDVCPPACDLMLLKPFSVLELRKAVA